MCSLPPQDSLAGICFDAYGTLFDVGPLLSAVDARIGAGAGQEFLDRLVPWTWLVTASERYRPLDEVAHAVLQSVGQEHGAQLDDQGARELVAHLHRLPLAPGAQEALEALEPAGLALLSNGTRQELEELVGSAGVHELFHHLLAADDVHRFKPAPQVYAQASVAFGVSSDRVLMVSSNAWDIAGASMAGLRTAWIGDQAASWVLAIPPDLVSQGLADLPGVLAGRGLIDFEPGGAVLQGRRAEPPPDAEDEGDEEDDYTGLDKVSADSFPASDPPAY